MAGQRRGECGRGAGGRGARGLRYRAPPGPGRRPCVAARPRTIPSRQALLRVPLPAIDARARTPRPGSRPCRGRGRARATVRHEARGAERACGGGPLRGGPRVATAAALRAGVESREDSTVEELVYDAGAVGGVVVRTGAGSRETVKARVVIGAD